MSSPLPWTQQSFHRPVHPKGRSTWFRIDCDPPSLTPEAERRTLSPPQVGTAPSQIAPPVRTLLTSQPSPPPLRTFTFSALGMGQARAQNGGSQATVTSARVTPISCENSRCKGTRWVISISRGPLWGLNRLMRRVLGKGQGKGAFREIKTRKAASWLACSSWAALLLQGSLIKISLV